MNSEERIQKQKSMVEEIGRYFDKEGYQPIAGRILGLLMVMDKEQFTFDEITAELNISKSSTSIALRNLELRGSIEYITISGDRKKYYRLKRQNAFEVVDDFERNLRLIKLMFANIIELKTDKDSENAAFYNELIKIIEFYLNNLKSLKEKYKKK